MTNLYRTGLERNAANYVPLTPLTFLERSASVYPDRLAVVHGARSYTWSETYARCRRLASALAASGVGPGETVSVMLANTPEMYECHFGVPMAGAVLHTINTRLDVETIAFMLEHGEARAVICDSEFAERMRQAVARIPRPLLLVDVHDSEARLPADGIGGIGYEELLAGGDAEYAWRGPADEWDAISLNYTSGTTGNPKGVVYHHRGAYLNAVSNIVSWGMPPHAVYLWTLPMFHCNGWCFPWTLAANSGTNICLRRVDAKRILEAIRKHRVTHYCGAPVVHSLLVSAPAAWREGIDHRVFALVAAAPPPSAVIEGMERIGFDITHVYGLTETYGPAAICAKHQEWGALTIEERTERNGRQGVRYHMQEAVTVLDPQTMQPVPRDGETMGEIMFRGNLTMKGYLKNPKATEEAFRGGWYHTGDLAVREEDGYVKIRDRSKGIIISGGENISSVEIEETLYRHPAVLTAAVVATPDPKWGEVPCAYVELREGRSATAEELREFCRERMAHFKVPKAFIFQPIPKTSTGKIQKYLLRQQVRSTAAIE